MKVHHGVENIEIKCPVVTIGSFDGVHLGHACVIQHLKEKAAGIDGESVIISFEPHPREVLYPREQKIGILTTLEEKISILEKYGVDHLIILKFTLEFAQQSYTDFVKKILVDKLKIKGLVVGYDHRFGKDRAGNFENLQELANEYGFFLEKEVVFEEDDVNVSSTKIRNALTVGDITTVPRVSLFCHGQSGLRASSRPPNRLPDSKYPSFRRTEITTCHRRVCRQSNYRARDLQRDA